MEYRGYTPDEVNKDKKKNIVYICLVMLPVLLGMFLLVGTISQVASVKIEDASAVSYESMEAFDEYYFDELVLVDGYASFGNQTTGYVEKNYYLVSFIDADGKKVYASLEVAADSELDEKCVAYIEDDSLTVGDVVLSGCFHGSEYGVGKYFEEAYELYNEQFPGEKFEWNLTYDEIETAEEYLSEKRSGESIMFIFAAMVLVPSAVGLFLLIRKRKELNQYLVDYNNESQNYNDPNNGPYNYMDFMER